MKQIFAGEEPSGSRPCDSFSGYKIQDLLDMFGFVLMLRKASKLEKHANISLILDKDGYRVNLKTKNAKEILRILI